MTNPDIPHRLLNFWNYQFGDGFRVSNDDNPDNEPDLVISYSIQDFPPVVPVSKGRPLTLAEFVERLKQSDTSAPQTEKENIPASFQEDLDTVLESLRLMLLDKNARYGDSALNPVRIFSKADALEQLRVRIDDSISRIKTATNDDLEDAKFDLVGNLILERIAMLRAEQNEQHD